MEDEENLKTIHRILRKDFKSNFPEYFLELNHAELAFNSISRIEKYFWSTKLHTSRKRNL
jgi:hypothetical protein